MLWQKPSSTTDPAPLTSFFFKSGKGNKAGANVSWHFPPHPSICSAANEGASRKLPVFSWTSLEMTRSTHHLFQHRPESSRVIGSKFMVYVIENSLYFIQRQEVDMKVTQIHPEKIHSDTYTLHHIKNLLPIKHILLGYIYKGLNTVRGREQLIACAWNLTSCGWQSFLLCVLQTVNHTQKQTSAVTEQTSDLLQQNWKMASNRS